MIPGSGNMDKGKVRKNSRFDISACSLHSLVLPVSRSSALTGLDVFPSQASNSDIDRAKSNDSSLSTLPQSLSSASLSQSTFRQSQPNFSPLSTQSSSSSTLPRSSVMKKLSNSMQGTLLKSPIQESLLNRLERSESEKEKSTSAYIQRKTTMAPPGLENVGRPMVQPSTTLNPRLSIFF